MEDVVPGVPAGAGRAGQGEQVGAARGAGRGARLDRGGADLLQALPAEQFAEAVDALLIDALEGFGRHIPAGEARAAGRDHAVGFGILDPPPQNRADGVYLVAHDGPAGQDVPVALQPLDQRVARAVVGLAARIGDGEHRDAHGNEGAAFVDAAGHFGGRSGCEGRRHALGGRPLAPAWRVSRDL